MSEIGNYAVIVEDLKKSFVLPHEQHSGIKQYLINLTRSKKGYETQNVLLGLDFKIKKGEFFGIVGRNGSGKSTLLKLLAGIYSPDNGAVVVDGTLVPFIELGVGFNPELTGRENIFLNGALLGFSRKQIQEKYDKIVKFSELERFMDQKLKNYSSGMQVRLAFSIAIQAKGDILLLDEVLAVGDAAFQQKCFDYFEQLKRNKKTVILVTHDMSAVQRFCTKALIIESGKIKAIGSPEKIANIYAEDNLSDSLDVSQVKSKNRIYAKLRDKVVDHKTEITFDFQTNNQTPTYIGFSLIKDGATIAEINSKDYPSNSKKDTLKYILETDKLNGGTYEISASLFSLENRSPLAYTSVRPRFVIERYDDRRGGGLNLADHWKV